MFASVKYAQYGFFKRDALVAGEVAQSFGGFAKLCHHFLDLNATQLCNFTQRELIRVIDHLIATRAARFQVFVEENAPVFFSSRFDQRASLRISNESSDTSIIAVDCFSLGHRINISGGYREERRAGSGELRICLLLPPPSNRGMKLFYEGKKR